MALEAADDVGKHSFPDGHLVWIVVSGALKHTHACHQHHFHHNTYWFLKGGGGGGGRLGLVRRWWFAVSAPALFSMMSSPLPFVHSATSTVHSSPWPCRQRPTGEDIRWLDRLASVTATWDSRPHAPDMPNVRSCPRQHLAITHKLGEETLRLTAGSSGNGCIHPRDWVGHLNRDERRRRWLVGC